jgi:hypothetical protein
MRMKIDDIAFHRVGGLYVESIAQSLESRLALVCPAETPAYEAIAIAKANSSPLILVTTDPAHPPHRDTRFESISVPGQKGLVVCGLVEPTHLRNALTSQFHQTSSPLLDLVTEYEQDQGQAQRRWRHEWLNLEQPVLEYCAQGGGHLTTLPCRYHSASAQALW